jgi:hypothetical protein
MEGSHGSNPRPQGAFVPKDYVEFLPMGQGRGFDITRIASSLMPDMIYQRSRNLRAKQQSVPV